MSQDTFRPMVFPAAQGQAKVVPREQLKTYERWELPVLEERVAPSTGHGAGHAPSAEQTAQLPTAGELQALHDRAYNEGWQAGLEEGRATVSARLATLNRAIEQANGLLAQSEEVLAPRLLNLVVAMAREVIRVELEAQPQSLLVVVREALAVLPSGAGTPNIHLHPDDVAWMREDPGVDRSWQLVAEPALPRGACRIEMGDSLVESDLADRWAKVLQAIGRDDAWQDASERGS